MTWCVVVLALVAAEPAGRVVVSLEQNKAAPFTGLLVPEARFVELLEAERRARELEIKLTIEERASEGVERLYHRRLEEVALTPWYDSPSLNRWFGVTCGMLAAGLAVWAAVEIQGSLR